MKKLLVLAALSNIITLSNAFAEDFKGSLKCSFSENGVNIPLRASKGDDYNEEGTELYSAAANSVTAEVLYLPYQYGIVVTLDSVDGFWNSDEGEDESNTEIEVDGNTYKLSCRK